MSHGTNGTILRVDLTAGSISTESFDDGFYRRYPGGKALAAYHLLRELRPGVDPLGPENLLVLATGLLTGAPISTATRFNAIARSPLTGGFGESEAGGYWGPELKMAGLDAILVTGRSPDPVYLWVKDGVAEIRDARHLWGQDPPAVQAAIREELGDRLVRVLQIGRAGENRVRYAMLMNELRHYNGRTGMGAVMGSKNLRAVAVRGSRRYGDLAHDPGALAELGRRLAKQVPEHPQAWDLRTKGTPGLTDAHERRRHPAHPQLPAGRLRARRRDRLRGLPGAAQRDPLLLRLRRALQAGDGLQRPAHRHRHVRRSRVRGRRRLRVRLRDRRPAGRRPGQRAVQRAGPRRHLDGRDHRLRHGVLRARPHRAGRHRRPRAALRERRGRAGDRPPHRRPQRVRRASGPGLAAGGRGDRGRRSVLRHAREGPGAADARATGQGGGGPRLRDERGRRRPPRRLPRPALREAGLGAVPVRRRPRHHRADRGARPRREEGPDLAHERALEQRREGPRPLLLRPRPAVAHPGRRRRRRRARRDGLGRDGGRAARGRRAGREHGPRLQRAGGLHPGRRPAPRPALQPARERRAGGHGHPARRLRAGPHEPLPAQGLGPPTGIPTEARLRELGLEWTADTPVAAARRRARRPARPAHGGPPRRPPRLLRPAEALALRGAPGRPRRRSSR